MKILVLNPQWHAEHPLVKALSARQFTVLLAPTTEEAWLLLQMQGSSIDVCLINRELMKTRAAPMSPPVGVNDGGLAFVQQIRRFQSGRQLPVVITSEYWRSPDFQGHAKTELAAEAYLALPCSPEQLLNAIRPFGQLETLEPAPVAEAPQKQMAPVVRTENDFEVADYEVMKMYLMLREKDVLALSGQVKELSRDLFEAKQALRHERMKSVEFQYRLEQEQRRNLDLAKDNQRMSESLQTEQDLQMYRRALEESRIPVAGAEPAPVAAAMPIPGAKPAAKPTAEPLPENFSQDFDEKSVFILKGKTSAASN
ncbi:MAG: hypothetical protein HY074_12380 [Deltaproteobacteria bacterium]|nr:hypothetical protein [Deltaproteobacteria bacterium]